MLRIQENGKCQYQNTKMKIKRKNKKAKGPNLYKKAKKIILGGNMLFSKKPEIWLPNYWPTYFSKASVKCFLRTT